MKKEYQIPAIILAVVLGLAFAQYFGLFSIFGEQYTYVENITFLGYNATAYSTQPFEGVNFSNEVTCGPPVTITSGAVNDISSNTLSLSSYNNVAPCGSGGVQYSVSSIVQIPNLDISPNNLNRLVIDYSSGNSISCHDNNLAGRTGASIAFSGISLYVAPSSSTQTGQPHSISDSGEITLNRINSTTFILNNSAGTSFVNIDSNVKDLEIIAAADPSGCNDAGHSSTNSITLSSLYMEYSVYDIVNNQCNLYSKNYLSINSSDYLNFSECQENLLIINTTCTPNWNCGNFSSCISNTQNRTCIDLNNCGTNVSKPNITQNGCQKNCTEDWTYSSWSSCNAGQQTRTAVDNNNCGTKSHIESLNQNCSTQTDYTIYIILAMVVVVVFVIYFRRKK